MSEKYNEIPIAGNIIEPGNAMKYKTGGWRAQRQSIRTKPVFGSRMEPAASAGYTARTTRSNSPRRMGSTSTSSIWNIVRAAGYVQTNVQLTA